MPFAQADGARIAWASAGTGEAILLVQGLGFSGAMWYRLVPLLAEHHRVITFDNRGTGATGTPPGPYTIEAMADDAIAVLDAAGVERAHVLGISMGGLIVQHLAADRPERVASLILAATSSGDPEVHVPPAAVVSETLITRASLPPRESIEVMLPFAYAESTPRARIDEDTQRRLDDPTSPEGYLNQIAGVSQWAGSLARLRGLKVPTLVIHGSEDQMVPRRNGEVLAEAIPGAEFALIEGAGHVLFTDVPERFAELITQFVAKVGRTLTDV